MLLPLPAALERIVRDLRESGFHAVVVGGSVRDALLGLEPKDIDMVALGQPVVLRYSAFNQRTTPELNGTVSRVAADTTNDQRTGQSYYLVRISMDAGELGKLGPVKLTPGMPVEAFIQTGERTLVSYLVKPLHDQLMRAVREK